MIKLLFTGDIVYKKNDNGTQLIEKELYDIINEHDIKCCNLEAPILQNENEVEKLIKVGPYLYQTPKDVQEIMSIGFNMYSIANNHIMDYGKRGLENTLEFLNNKIVIGAGISEEKAYQTYVYEQENRKIGFMSIAENGFGACLEKNEYGYAWMNNKVVEDKIKELKQECQYVILNCHAGAELFEHPLPEIRELYKKLIDDGVDIIIGHHPHIIQGYEKYKEGIIFYSLGNFIFSGAEKEECRKSYCVSITLENSIKWNIIPVIFENGQVKLDKEENAFNRIEELSKTLNTEEYIKKVDSFCLQCYRNIYKKYYLACFNINRINFLNRIKSCIKLLFQLKKDNEKILYHNLVIETHLWICKRALRLIIKKENEIC